jgi:hypothetical protein
MSKTKTYYVTHTIYVCMDIEAKSEQEALDKFDKVVNDEKKYLSVIYDSESDTEANES